MTACNTKEFIWTVLLVAFASNLPRFEEEWAAWFWFEQFLYRSKHELSNSIRNHVWLSFIWFFISYMRFIFSTSNPTKWPGQTSAGTHVPGILRRGRKCVEGYEGGQCGSNWCWHRVCQPWTRRSKSFWYPFPCWDGVGVQVPGNDTSGNYKKPLVWYNRCLNNCWYVYYLHFDSF